MRLEFLGYSIVFLAAIFAVFNRDKLNPGVAGISITYALNITGILSFLVQVFTMLETNFVSIERLIEYDNVLQEVCSDNFLIN